MNVNYPKVFITVTAFVLLASASVCASEMDSRIESAAKQSYVFKTYLKDDSVKLESKDGAVTLTGTVKEESHKSLAEATVASLPGVASVDNKLELTGVVPAENSDSWIGTKVKTSLLFHRNVNAFKTEVDVKDGVVTLKGEALSQAQKDLAGAYAKDVAGVKDLKNEMTIAEVSGEPKQTLGDKIDDASITAQVKVALMYHNSTSALKTKVSTIDGVVTVSGVARNDAEKTLVSKLANDVNGVSTVVNNMTVAPPVLPKV